MGKWANTANHDAYLNQIKDNSNLLCACSAQPTTRTEAVATYRLATAALDALDFSLSPGASGGRRLTISAKSNIPIVTSGDLTHIALVSNSAVYLVTTTSTLALASGNLLNTPAWAITVNGPA